MSEVRLTEFRAIKKTEKGTVYIAIDHHPTIDAVEVVRCRDCVYAHLTMSGQVKRCEKRVDDDGFMVEEYRESSFYCADGERKEAADGRSD